MLESSSPVYDTVLRDSAQSGINWMVDQALCYHQERWKGDGNVTYDASKGSSSSPPRLHKPHPYKQKGEMVFHGEHQACQAWVAIFTVQFLSISERGKSLLFKNNSSFLNPALPGTLGTCAILASVFSFSSSFRHCLAPTPRCSYRASLLLESTHTTLHFLSHPLSIPFPSQYSLTSASSIHWNYSC